MTSIWQDVRYSLRMIAKAPGFAVIAILTLALGIGANTTIFSWINSALLNPVPGLSSPNEVVALTLSKPGENPFAFTYPDIQAMRNGQQSFTGITVCNIGSMSLTGKANRIACGAWWRPQIILMCWACGRFWGAGFCRKRTRSRAALRWR